MTPRLITSSIGKTVRKQTLFITNGEDPLEEEMTVQCSCLENSTDSRAWHPTVHGVAGLDMTTTEQQQQHAFITFHFKPNNRHFSKLP